MLFKRALAAVSAAAVMMSAGIFTASAEETGGLSDSGIDYTESNETIKNPAAGYTKTIWARCKPNETPVYDPVEPLVLFFVDIGGFSSGNNGVRDEDGSYTPGEDYDLDETFFESWRQTLENCRKNGCMVAFRFRYDAVGNDDPEPAAFEQVLRHIDQIRESDLLNLYAENIAFVESGFVGKWGEQHGGKYTSLDYKARLLEAMLRAVPAPIPVTVRTPDTFAKWAGIERSQLDDFELIDSLTESEYSQSIDIDKYRVGMYDDGYMGSDSDLGTYANREKETTWLSRQTLTSYFGGEFSGNLDFAQKYDTYLPENAIPEMYKTHLSYINENIFQLYKDYKFTKKLSPEGINNSAYYGQSVFKFIRDHIGYRFVLRSSLLTQDVVQGGTVDVRFAVENTGFANLIPYTPSYVVLERDGVYTMAAAEVKCNNWLSGEISPASMNFRIPDNLPAGQWKVCLRLPVAGCSDPANMSAGVIRFANNDVWMPSIGANYLGTINVSESVEKGTDCSLGTELHGGHGFARYYTYKDITAADGVETTPYEWSEEMLVGENESGEKLYVKADTQYLYVMGRVPMNGASGPVYNIQLKCGGESYWMYFASNGFVYFNHGSYMDSLCRWSEDMVEFRIPFEVLGLSNGDEITDLRLFLQDMGNDWVLMSDVRAPKVTVNLDIKVLSACTPIRCKAGDSFSVSAMAIVLSDAEYVWRHDGEIIEGFDYLDIDMENVAPEDAGKYTVTVTTESGIVREIEVFDLEVVTEDEGLKGDANCDGKVTIADAAAILQFLGNGDKYRLTEQGRLNADCDGDTGVTTNDALTIQKSVAGIG